MVLQADNCSETAASTGKQRLAAVLLIVVLTVAVYGQMAGHGFVTLDDSLYVTQNPHVRSGLTPGGVKWAFTTFHAEFWHPMVWLSLMADTSLYGFVPGGYLFTNLLLHILNAIFVFYFFELATSRVWESFIVAALFALHPLHVEPVAWISERKELLGAFFWFLSMLAYYSYSQKPGFWRYLLVLLLFALGIMSKPMVVTFPFAMLLIDYWPLARDRAGATGEVKPLFLTKRWAKLFAEKIPLICLSVAGSVLAIIAQQHGGGIISVEKFPVTARIANIFISYGNYLKKAVWPRDLAVIYPLIKHPDVGAAIAWLLVLAVITLACLYPVRQQRWAAVGWLWFLGTLVPVIGIVKVGNFSMADRYAYIPLTGILVIAAFGLGALVCRLKTMRIWRIVVTAVLVGAFVPITFLQVGTWKNSGTLYGHAIKVTRGNYLAHYSMGNFLASHGRMLRAILHFSRALSLQPDNALFAISLGRALAATGRWRQAERFFLRARRNAPESPVPYFFVGCALAARYDIDGAVASFSAAMKKDEMAVEPDNPQKQIMAVRCLRAGLEQEQKRNYNEAIRQYLKALVIFPGYPDAVEHLARVYLLSGDPVRSLGVYTVPANEEKLRVFVCRGYERWQKDMLSCKRWEELSKK